MSDNTENNAQTDSLDTPSSDVGEDILKELRDIKEEIKARWQTQQTRSPESDIPDASQTTESSETTQNTNESTENRTTMETPVTGTEVVDPTPTPIQPEKRDGLPWGKRR
jgi:hypothetical protein